ncbi:uncharacterized protein LOC106142945 [Amyelois transitella]|uniref:uncharacterized protein LOC106142945 n=1 Tax=Amyelois transitella TaxID=680683 RepID=UPI0029901616|nr:uncharacterized protein LOC106142945 [Amyelois transitella]
MAANDFVAKLKANGTENDLCDLDKVISEYKTILTKLSPKDRSSFSLNILCILCRNIDKVPSWRDSINPKLLLILSIDCVREIGSGERPDQVKTLACVYHIHRFIIRLKSSIPPELVLKISFMPFECDVKNMLTEYVKTYWSIVVDRITYIERLKAGKVAIIKLLPKLIDDTLKVIQIYNTVQFCTNALTYLIKKLHFLYNDRHSIELNETFRRIFDSLTAKSDLKDFKKLSVKEITDLYIKFNDCYYVIVENNSRDNFKDSILTNVVRTYISFLGHCPDVFHCFQTFYSNGFCNIFNCMTNSNYNETIFNSLLMSFETTEKLGYSKLMYVTYPFINQLLRLYIDYSVANVKDWKQIFTDISQECYLKLILAIMSKAKHSEQLLKCDNCTVKSGLHDALRLSFLSIHFVKQNNEIQNILPIFYTIIEEQHSILKELMIKGCTNYEKCYRKLQTDIHNTAIVLNKSEHNEYSIKLFNIYLSHEISSFKDESDLKNISRALYNKSICQLDTKMYENALKDAYLSMVFAWPELMKMNSEKYMSLVMDIKAKALKASDEGCQDKLQLVSVLDVCKMCMKDKLYGNLKPFFVPLKFSALLKHEFSMYAKLWPSIVPIAGVWKSLYELACNNYTWLAAEDEAAILSTLCDVILETSAAVRTLYSDYYMTIIDDLIGKFDEKSADSAELQIVQAGILFLKSELDLQKASEKYGWKITEPIKDPDDVTITRTAAQEYEAARRAIQAVGILTDLLPDLTAVPVTKRLRLCLEIAEIFVQQLLHLDRRVHGLQLSYICCVLAERLGEKSSYIRNAGVLLSNSYRRTDKLTSIMLRATHICAELMTDEITLDTALVYVCDAAIYNVNIGATGTAARLLQIAQAQIISAFEKYPNINLDLSIGRLLQGQCSLCKDSGPSSLSAVSVVQRHYLSISNVGTSRHRRRLASLTVKRRRSSSALRCVRVSRALLLRRRVRTWSAVAAPCASALAAAALCVLRDDVNIDGRLKYILGITTTNETFSQQPAVPLSKPEVFTPKQDLETMLENATFKKSQLSPSIPCITVPGYRTPECLKHVKCDCYACEIPLCYILSACTVGLEAARYFRGKEVDIAKNYFKGAFECFDLAERKLVDFKVDMYEEFIVDGVRRKLMTELKEYQVEMLIEASFFELSINNYERADEIIVKIHEISQEYDLNGYLSNEVMNLIVASAELRNVVKKRDDTNLINEFESLKLTPSKDVEVPKTPEVKPKAPPKMPKVTVKDEEIPKKRKVIKLNLDEVVESKPIKKKTEFKIPIPVTSKHVLENITPRITRTKPNILVSQHTDDVKTPVTDFHTPIASTPDEFFTPMTSLKTYSKKSLRHNIVKNLESEFATPKADNSVSKLDVPKSKAKDNKKTLKRATSPGKLVREVPTRSGRKPAVKPIKFGSKDEK